MQTFMHWCTARAAPPFALCADVRLLVHMAAHQHACRRCGCATETARGVCACFSRDGRLCFTCYHRARWPRP